MSNQSTLHKLEESIGYRFQTPGLLEQALTHRSYTNEPGNEEFKHNETLEFLGDAILGFIISYWLFEKFPDVSEGTLTKFKSYLVNSSHLANCANQLNLGDFLRLNQGEEKTGGRKKQTLLENAFEALIGAIYLDSDLKTTTSLIKFFFAKTVETLDPNLAVSDPKTTLQQLVQANKMPLPKYVTTSSVGPPHKPEFTVGLLVNNKIIAEGKGPTLKKAHQAAASIAIQYLKNIEDVTSSPA